VIRLILPVCQIHAIVPCSGAAGAYFRPELIEVLVPRVGLVVLVVDRRRSCVDEVFCLNSQRNLAVVAVCCITTSRISQRIGSVTVVSNVPGRLQVGHRQSQGNLKVFNDPRLHNFCQTQYCSYRDVNNALVFVEELYTFYSQL